MVEAVTIREIERIFEVTDGMGIHREALAIPLRPGRPGAVRRLPDGKFQIVVDADMDFDEWLAGLAERLRSVGQ